MKNSVVMTAKAATYEDEPPGATLVVEVLGAAIAMNAVSTLRRACESDCLNPDSTKPDFAN
jgi:hypothetical protein